MKLGSGIHCHQNMNIYWFLWSLDSWFSVIVRVHYFVFGLNVSTTTRRIAMKFHTYIHIYEWHHEDKSKLLLQSPHFSSSATNRSKFSLTQHDVSTSTKWTGINRRSCSRRMNANNLTLLIPWPVLARVQCTVQRKCASGVAWDVCMDILAKTLFF